MVGDHVRGAPLCKLLAHPRSALDPASFLEAILTLMEVSGSSILQLWQQFSPTVPGWGLNLSLHSDLRCYSQIFFFFWFLGLHQRHMEVPRIGAELEL